MLGRLSITAGRSAGHEKSGVGGAAVALNGRPPAAKLGRSGTDHARLSWLGWDELQDVLLDGLGWVELGYNPSWDGLSCVGYGQGMG